MNGLDHPIFYAAFMLVAGLGISIFAALSGNLGARLQNPVLAAIVALSVGIVACLGVMLLSGNIPNRVVEGSIPFLLSGQVVCCLLCVGYNLGWT